MHRQANERTETGWTITRRKNWRRRELKAPIFRPTAFLSAWSVHISVKDE
jgi:hypothetical protein